MNAHLLLDISAATSPLWFAARAAGVISLVLLTFSTVLGITTARRWESVHAPRYFTALLHRNIALFTVVFLMVHIVTAVADPFALLHPIDAVLPFSGAYRTEWLTLGVISSDLLIAVTITSLLRRYIGPSWWRLVHWAAYVSWPLGVMHSLGTGTDAQTPWLLGLTASCVAAVAISLVHRLAQGRWQTFPVRAILTVSAAAVICGMAAWTVAGPLQADWVVASGTPKSILTANAASHEAMLASRNGFTDQLIGTSSKSGGALYISLRDTTDTQITVVIAPAPADSVLPVITVSRNGKKLCSGAASVSQTFYTVCGQSRLSITLYQGAGTTVTGTLESTGKLS